MKLRTIHIIFLLIGINGMQFVLGQKGFYGRALEQYGKGNLLEGKEYIEYYLRYHDEPGAWFLCGKIHSALNDNQNAHAAFLRAAMDTACNPEYILSLVKSSMAADSMEMALQWCHKLVDASPADEEAQEYLEFLLQAKKIPVEPSVDIRYLPFNSTSPDFCAVPANDGIIFSSQRPNSNAGINFRSQGTHLPLPDLYFAGKNAKGNWKSAVALPGNLNHQQFPEGPVLLLPDSSTILFSRSFPGNKSNRGNLWYTATSNGREWKESGLLNIQFPDAEIGQVAISPDGKCLWVSALTDGGTGGFDLYRMEWKESAWTNPVNAGRKINSRGNEVFPFLVSDQTLYFSSDGHPGFGGLDIFRSHPVSGEYVKAVNAGPPLNSRFDDFSVFLSSTDPPSGYFSSNRKAGGLDDDMYWFLLPEVKFENCPEMVVDEFCYNLEETNIMQELPAGLFYEWEFGDGLKAAGKEVRHCFEKEGNYTISLNVVDSATSLPVFNHATYQLHIDATRQLLIDISGQPVSGREFEYHANMDLVSGFQPSEYYWDFGDGFSTKGPDARHTFWKAGQHEVRLGVKGMDLLEASEATRCITRRVLVSDPGELATGDDQTTQPGKQMDELESVFHAGDINDPRYKVQLGVSENILMSDEKNFMGIENIELYRDGEIYRYLVGNEHIFDSAWSILVRVREQGFERSVILAFGEGKIKSVKPAEEQHLLPEGNELIVVTGILRDERDSAIAGDIIIEDLMNGKIILTSTIEHPDSGYRVSLPKSEGIGMYAGSADGFSLSSRLDLSGHIPGSEISQDLKIETVESLVESGESVVLHHVLFERNSFQVKPYSLREIHSLVRLLKENANIGIEIAGHADGAGNPEANLALSKRRAAEIAMNLAMEGIDPARIISIGYANTRPVASNASNHGRALNRRVEFRLYLTPGLHQANSKSENLKQ